MFGNLPKIEVKPTPFDRKVILVGWVLVALTFIEVALFYSDLPDIIPTHFNIKGKADGFGKKAKLWQLPIINLILYVGTTLLATKMKPWNYNYTVKVTEKNAPEVYAMGIRLLVWINLGMALLFLLISSHSIATTLFKGSLNFGWLMITLVLAIVILSLIYMVKMHKVPKA